MSRRTALGYAMGMDIDDSSAHSVEPNYLETLEMIRYQFESIHFTASNCPIHLPTLLFVNHKY